MRSLLDSSVYHVFGAEQLRTSCHPVEGGVHQWRGDHLALSTRGPEWAGAALPVAWPDLLPDKRNLLIQVFVSGEAELAGLSFGPYRDFLTQVSASPKLVHCLQLELDRDAGYWTFRVDGLLQPRAWWDSGIGGIEDIFNGSLTLKAKKLREVVFHGLTIRAFESPCRVSVVMTCHRFVQRLRVTLRNWCWQDVLSGAIEVLVVNPESPDGLHEHLAAVSAACPHLRLREIVVPATMARNKGAMINRAVQAARGEWIWLTDSDCLFDRNAAATALFWIQNRPRRLLYCERKFLSHENTQALLAGAVDGCEGFAQLSGEPMHCEAEPYGYTQIVPKVALTRWPYREDLNHYADSDLTFLERCRRNQVRPVKIEGLYCLHMAHPFAWHGTSVFL
jgi:hypothetical protein